MVAEFVCQVGPGQVDFSGLDSWLQTMAYLSLIDGTTKVFAGSRGPAWPADYATVEGELSGASGTANHCTTSQVLISDIVGVFLAGEKVWDSGDHAKYFTISDAGTETELVAECATDGSAVDEVTLGSVGEIVTDSTHRIIVRAAAGHEAQLPFDSSRYYAKTISGPVELAYPDFVFQDIQLLSPDSVTVITYDSVAFNLVFDRCLFKTTYTGAYNSAAAILLSFSDPGSKLVVRNCFFQDYIGQYAAAIYCPYQNASDWTIRAYANTIQNCSIGFRHTTQVGYGPALWYVRSNLIDALDAFSGSFADDDVYNDYNQISEVTDDPACGSHGGYGKTFLFVDEDGDDFHLAAADTGARGLGEDLSAEGVSLDFDSEVRTYPTDAGADQYFAPAATGGRVRPNRLPGWLRVRNRSR